MRRHMYYHEHYINLCLLVSTYVHARVFVCAYAYVYRYTYIVLIMLYTQSYIILTSCTFYINYCVMIINLLHSY